MSLTDMTIRSLKPPPQGTVTLWDKTVSGLGLRCSQGGTKTFIVMLRRDRSRVRIGHYPEWTLKDARTQAIKVIAERAGKPTPKRISFETAFETFKETHTANQRASTRSETERLIKAHFLSKLRTRSITEISTKELTDIIDKLSDTPGTANHAFAAARLLFGWAVKRRMIERSPLAGLGSPTPIRFRERVLTDQELVKVFTTANSSPSTIGKIVQLLVLTGQRRGEIAGLRWSWIDEEARTITFPAEHVKNGRTHTIPYGDMVAAVLSSVQKTGDLLFPARGQTARPFCGWSKTGLHFVESCGTDHFTLHDLRRTFASGLQRIGIRMEITEKLLNHISGSFAGIVSVYQKYTYAAEMREALQKWEDRLTSLLLQQEDI